ncbi:MAG: ATP-binding cassette domain-containing protein, partial [Clostridia bacterium]|nr:ATP-binding cassette domain-containing protein [Clostridia bacterium]
MLCIQLRSMTYPNGYVALENVSLEFGDSGLYCLVGESGSGKSTLLQCISGMQEFDGDLFYDGKKLDGRDKIDFNRADIAYVFQDFRLFDGLSVMDNVIFGGEIAGNKIAQDFA